MASLVQDVWLGWDPRLRARRFAPWEEPAVRLLFCPEPVATLDDPPLLRFLESLASRIEVIAWEPRGQGGSSGRPGPEVLEDARRLVAESPSRWGGTRRLVLGGHGLGGWLALAAADRPGVTAAFALGPALETGGVGASSLREALQAALSRPPLAVPTLVIDSRDSPPEERERVGEWIAREPLASRIASASGELLSPPWDEVVRAWTGSVGGAGEASR